MDLNLVKLVFNGKPAFLTALAPLLSGKGAIFEDAVRHVCCTQKYDSCRVCPSYQLCPASILIAKELSQDPLLVKHHQKPAFPFVFKQMPAYDTKPAAIGLVLLGPACFHLATLFAALDHIIGSAHRYRVAAFDYQDTAVPIEWTDHAAIIALPLLNAAELLARQNHRFINCSRVQLLLQTPLRIVKETRELGGFEPEVFCRSVVRRISSLVAYYGDIGLDHDLFRQLMELSREVRLIKALGGTQSASGFTRGVTGCYELSGPFDELGPFLYLGSLVQVGKRASYGLGGFDIIPIL